MIRNVVLGRLHPDAPAGAVEAALAAMVALELDGCLDLKAGVDAGLREGNWSFSITADFVDEDAYRRYDLDEEHNRIRREMFAPISAEIARIQFDA
jgi:hypothetical protein